MLDFARGSPAGFGCLYELGPMKKIEAIIKPLQLDDVKAALRELGVTWYTIAPVTSFSRPKGQDEFRSGLIEQGQPKVRIEIVTEDALVERTVSVVERAAHTGRTGDGRIFVTDIEQAVRIRTGARGDDAV
jgi:nitrogen regulatory protein P-II 1